MSPEEIEYISQVKGELVGNQITEVHYEEEYYESNNPEFSGHDSDKHYVDISLILKLVSRKVVKIYWDKMGYDGGILFSSSTKRNNNQPGFTIFNVSESKEWQKLIGVEILEIDILWTHGRGRPYRDGSCAPDSAQRWTIGFPKAEVRITMPALYEDVSHNDAWNKSLIVSFYEK